MVEYDWQPAKSEARAHQEKFEIEWDEHKQQFVILHENLTFAVITAEGHNLPEGFPARAAAHLFEMLIGRRGSLWDEQAIYGEHARDPLHAQHNGDRMARHLMKQLQDRGVYVPPDVPPSPPIAASPATPGQLAYEADRAANPTYYDGRTPRPEWSRIGTMAQQQWERRAKP